MKNQKIFLGMLKSFLHPDEKLPGTRKLEQEDWEEILDMASIHAVLPIIYEASWKKVSFQKLPEHERMKCKTLIKRMIVTQTQRTGLFLELYQKILDAGITPLVMKGLVCRDMYRLGDYRISGDEDLLIKIADFSKMDQMLLQYGFQREKVDDYRKEHEITYYNPQSGMHLEVHLSLFSEESGAYGRLNQEFPQIFERHVIRTIQGVEVHTLDETQHMLYLLCHGLKHFLHSGFGIRQLCDMVMFAETYGEVIDWKEVKRRTKRQHMYIFWMNLFDIGERYLGFSWSKAMLKKPDKKLIDSDELLQDILDSGVFGKSTNERLHSANYTLQAADCDEAKGSGLIRSLFPSFEYMKRRYPYLEKKKWCLPLAYLQRIIDYGNRLGGKGAMKTMEKGKERVVLLEKYGIIEKEAAKM